MWPFHLIVSGLAEFHLAASQIPMESSQTLAKTCQRFLLVLHWAKRLPVHQTSQTPRKCPKPFFMAWQQISHKIAQVVLTAYINRLVIVIVYRKITCNETLTVDLHQWIKKNQVKSCLRNHEVLSVGPLNKPLPRCLFIACKEHPISKLILKFLMILSTIFESMAVIALPRREITEGWWRCFCSSSF